MGRQRINGMRGFALALWGALAPWFLVGCAPSSPPRAPLLVPRAVTPVTTFEFAAMEPGGEGTHAFVIRNEGAGPLELSAAAQPGETTTCTVLQGTLLPGQAGAVRVTWKTRPVWPVYTTTAVVRTNDPQRPTIELTVEGIVRAPLAAAPAQLVFDGIDPRQPATAATVVFSQLWEQFTVDRVECSLAGATWNLSPASAEKLADFTAKSGYEVVLQLPAAMPTGPFQGTVRLHVISPARGQPEGNEREAPAAEPDGAGAAPGTAASPAAAPHQDAAHSDAAWLELAVTGRVLRRLALYGEGLDPSGTLDLGYVPVGQGRRHRLRMKIRDPEPAVQVKAISSVPEFLQVALTPVAPDGASSGMYELEIVVPPDAPLCQYRGLHPGEIHIDVEHPRAEDVTLQVFFAVEDRPPVPLR